MSGTPPCDCNCALHGAQRPKENVSAWDQFFPKGPNDVNNVYIKRAMRIVSKAFGDYLQYLAECCANPENRVDQTERDGADVFKIDVNDDINVESRVVRVSFLVANVKMGLQAELHPDLGDIAKFTPSGLLYTLSCPKQAGHLKYSVEGPKTYRAKSKGEKPFNFQMVAQVVILGGGGWLFPPLAPYELQTNPCSLSFVLQGALSAAALREAAASFPNMDPMSLMADYLAHKNGKYADACEETSGDCEGFDMSVVLDAEYAATRGAPRRGDPTDMNLSCKDFLKKFGHIGK